jgi:hypothetical protein
MPGRLAIHRVALPPSYLKTCTRCQQEKPRSNFTLDYRRLDCYQSWCNSCHHRSRLTQGPKLPPGAFRIPGVEQPPDSLKTCSTCKQDLPRSSFYREKARPDGRCPACRSCRIAANRIYSSEQGDQIKQRRRASRAARRDYYRGYQLKWGHGITLDEYNAILASQEGGCAICGGPQVAPHKHLCVDHCHATGKIRGLLCSPCNKSLGLFRDNPDTLRAAAQYIEASRG